jgi:uncharacterized protein (DUF3820 family)
MNPEILLELVNMRMPFGKYKGRNLYDVSEENPSYIKWLDEKGIL